jgi:predicted DNA-binding protein with PD1-like motif
MAMHQDGVGVRDQAPASRGPQDRCLNTGKQKGEGNPMRSKLINDGPQRTFAVVFDKGDEVLENLLAFAREHDLSAAEFTGLGALSDAVLGYFDWQQKDYLRISIDEQVEVLNLTGNVALDDGEPKLHPHIVLGKRDGTAHGGHLLEGHVRPTLEVIVTESPAHLRRQSDPETGLALVRL